MFIFVLQTTTFTALRLETPDDGDVGLGDLNLSRILPGSSEPSPANFAMAFQMPFTSIRLTESALFTSWSETDHTRLLSDKVIRRKNLSRTSSTHLRSAFILGFPRIVSRVISKRYCSFLRNP